jgi:hypothetical protein
MSDHDDFAFEPQPGLPAPLPPGEDLLWQGQPATLALAREAFKLNWILAYMGVVALWRGGAAWADGGPALALATALPYLVLAAAAAGVVLALAWAQARASIYTITSARVLMRIGAALPVTFNLPFSQIEAAALAPGKAGHGTIALTLKGDARLSYAILWPHARPWEFRRTQPALRAIPDAEAVARLLAETARARLSMPVVRRIEVAAPGAIAAE